MVMYKIYLNVNAFMTIHVTVVCIVETGGGGDCLDTGAAGVEVKGRLEVM